MSAVWPSFRRFRLVRSRDETGVSGTGVVAEGVEFSNGVVALQWVTEWPTSVVFHERGVASVEHVHGHGGATAIDWLDQPALFTDEAYDFAADEMVALRPDVELSQIESVPDDE